MTTVQYLEKPIAQRKYQPAPLYSGMTVDGYTKRSGAPSAWMIRIRGEKRWRRLMIWQFSNAGTCFVRILGECLIVREYDLPHVDAM